jgi:hypothetical protein
VERGRKSALERGQRDRGVNGQRPGPGPAPSHRFAPHRGLAPIYRPIDQLTGLATRRESGGDQMAPCPAVLRVLPRQEDVLPGARLALFAPNQEDRGPDVPDQDPDQDPDREPNQDEPALDSDQNGRMDDPVDRPVPRAPAILPAARPGLRFPVTATARGRALPPPRGRRNPGSVPAHPQPGRVADRVEDLRVSLVENRVANLQASLVENQAEGRRATFRRASQRVRSQEHDREPKLAADSRD